MKKLLNNKGVTILSKSQQKKITGGAALSCLPEGAIGCVYIGGKPGPDGCCEGLVCKQIAVMPPNSGYVNICRKP